MTRFFKYLTTRNADGDTPLELAAALTVFLICLAILMHL